MSEEMITEVTPELFQLKSGQLILSEELSRKMFYIMNAHPESRQLDNSGYSWDESGMAELFPSAIRTTPGTARNRSRGTPTTMVHGVRMSALCL